ncbi:MAG: hypothetical protein J5699_07100 [Bacteroidales bacterium]|nr:hypothetical protein [Bacteroidales bacterium]
MKRIVQVILLLLVAMPAGNATVPFFLHEMNGRVGAGDAFYLRAGYARTASDVGRWYEDAHSGYTYVGLMDKYYHDYVSEVFSSGTFTLEGGYNWQGRWGFGLNLGLTGVTARWKSAVTGEGIRSDRSRLFYVLPEVRYYYVYNDAFRLYSSAGLGLAYPSASFGAGQASFGVLQLNPVGVEFGGRFFGFAEFGFGDMFDYLRGGIGFRL